MPESFKSFLAHHNGEDDDSCGLIFGLRFLSCEQIKSNWDAWLELEGDGQNEEYAESMSSKPEGVIKPLYQNRNWIPITHDFSSNHIGIDFDPDTQGVTGQIIAFGRTDDEKKLKAHSFEEFVDIFISQLHGIDWTIGVDGWSFTEKKYDSHYHGWE